MQRKASGGGGGRGSADTRRPLLQTAYAPVPAPPHPAFMSMGNLGMTMSNMDNSLRAFAPSADSTPAPFWRPTALLDPHQQQHMQYKSTSSSPSLDLEFNDLLGGNGGRDISGHGDASMGDVATSFQVPTSFSSLVTPSSVAPLNMSHMSLLPGNQRPLGPSSSASTSPTSDASSTRSTMTSAAMTGASMARPAVPVAAATGAPDASDYSRFVDSTDEPDLSQQKIEQKNEKCQYHNCPNRARVSQAYGKFCNRHVIVAPCGFPGCRDKALLHSSMCDKHLAEGKDALHRILANRAQNVPVCRTFGCFKNDQGRGYCRGHEKLLMATGRLPKHINKRRLNSAYTMCSYPNCNKHSQRNHLCRTHGNVILKQAEEIAKQSNTGESFEDALARLQKEIRRCTHPTCTKNSQRDRLCTMHYYEKHNLSRDGVPGKDADGHLSGTDAGGESDGDHGMCTVGGCSSQAESGRGMCKFHSEQSTPSSNPPSRRAVESQGPDGTRSHPICSISGCGNVAPYASGLCQHHGNKTNQAIEITRINPHAVTGGAISGGRPNPGDGSNYQNPGATQFLPSPTGVPDPSTTFAPGLDRFSSGGTTGRMAGLSVSGGMPSSSAESDARQALVTLNGVNKHPGGNIGGDARSGHSGSTTCANPICSRECYGREFCESCQNMFSPLVVSVGDGNNSNPYQFPSLGLNNQSSLQPEPETDALWDGSTQARVPGAKTRDLCRVKDCANMVARAGGLCDDHLRQFQTGNLSVDELMLRSRQLREEKERAAAAAAAAAAAEMKQITSPKVKKYFCKVDGCDKQAQKRGLCKRHFRLQEGNALMDKSPQSGPATLGEQLVQPMSAYQTQNCRFPGCAENVSGSPTCPSHCKATFCWQSGCENLVESPQFCEYHAYRRECAYDGCTYTANRDSSGCINHVMERRCTHEYCEQFANARSDRCRLHADNCIQQPCALCELHGLREPGPFHLQGKTPMSYANGVKNSMDMFRSNGGNNDFVDERELTRDSVFGDRLL